MLDCSKKDRDYVLQQRKRPVAIIAKLRQCIASLSGRGLLSVPQHNAMEKTISDLNNVIMRCERLQATPIPPVYTSHATRLMIFYLLFLPLALCGSGLNELSSVLMTAVVGYAMLGLDEISHLLEEPFRLMPMYELCKISTVDAADAMIMTPPSADNYDDDDDDDDGAGSSTNDSMRKEPSYWPPRELEKDYIIRR